MKQLPFSKKTRLDISGDKLVANFHEALINLVTMDAAQAEAKRSEADITNTLRYVSSGTYLNPANIPDFDQQAVVRGSVDAHMKKVQAEQISTMTMAQVSQLEQETLGNYKGRKVRITRLDGAKDVFTPLSINQRTGQLVPGTFKGQTVTGKIDDLSFDKNILIIVPTAMARAILPARRYFLVNVINMATLTPAVKINLI